MPLLLNSYQTVANITERMLEHARAHEWEVVITLSQDYAAGIEAIKTLNTAENRALSDTAAMQQLLTKTLENDAKIRELAAPELERLGGLLGSTKLQKNVVQAYCAPSMNQ